jgi:hypothetical protein
MRDNHSPIKQNQFDMVSLSLCKHAVPHDEIPGPEICPSPLSRIQVHSQPLERFPISLSKFSYKNSLGDTKTGLAEG